MGKKYLSLSFLFIPFLLYSQYQDPASIHWKQIKTEHFQVVFPEEIISRGIQTANILEHAYKPVCKTLNEYPKRIPLFLFNQSAISNGYTTLAPRHIGFYTTPPQDATMVGGSDWIQTLATHEFRHAVQFSKFDKNFTNFIGHIFGDYGKMVTLYWAVPDWFLEGDAVCTETVLTEDGRGRMPFFTRDIRALELEHKRFSYDKAYLGSYKDYYPDLYHIGYLMTAHVTKNFGPEAWDKILTRTSEFSFSPFSFSGSLRKFTGSSLKRTYQNTLDEFNSIWTSKEAHYPVSGFTKVNQKIKKSWTSYEFPFFISNDSIITLKSSLQEPSRITIISKDKEIKLAEINPIDRMHSNGHFVVWSSETSAIRWWNRSFADIMIYDLHSHSRKRLTHRTKYYAPAISPDGNRIAAVEFGTGMKCSLTIIDRVNGKVLNKYSFPDSLFIRMPSWSDDGKNIVFTQTWNQLKTISILNLQTGEIKNVLPYNPENISNPVFYQDYILYNSPYTGIDAILAVNIADGNKYIVATGKYAIYNANLSPDRKDIVFENYTTGGFDICKAKSDLKLWMPADQFEAVHDNYYKFLIETLKGGNIYENDSLKIKTDYKIKNYWPLLHSINIHSWAPYPINGGIGLNLFSNDALNTTALSLGANYFPDQKASLEFATISYAKLFPVISAEISYGWRYLYVDSAGTGTSIFTGENEKLARVYVTLPFNFSRNIYTTTLNITGGYDYIVNSYPNDIMSPGFPYSTSVSAVEAGLIFSRLKQMALRDVQSKFGQTLTINYWNAPFNTGTRGERYNAFATFYLPGFIKNQGISLTAGYEYNSDKFIPGIYELTTDLEFVRGYSNVAYDHFLRGLVVYSMPVYYPDLALGPVIYCTRIRTDLFYDYGIAYLNGRSGTYNSTGIDLNFDVNLFRIPIPFNLGVRYSYRITDNTSAFNFLFLGVAF